MKSTGRIYLVMVFRAEGAFETLEALSEGIEDGGRLVVLLGGDGLGGLVPLSEQVLSLPAGPEVLCLGSSLPGAGVKREELPEGCRVLEDWEAADLFISARGPLIL